MLIKVIATTNYALSTAAALTALGRYRRLAPALRLIALLACFDAATETALVLLGHFFPGKSNLFLFPVSLAGEGLLLTLAYRRVLAGPRLGRALLRVLAAYLAFVLADAWLKLGTVQYYVVEQVVSDLLMLGLATLYFRQLLHALHAVRLRRDPFFWISSGLVVYALGTMLIALSSDYAMTHFSVAGQRLLLLGIRNLFNITLYLAYFVALWLPPLKPNF